VKKRRRREEEEKKKRKSRISTSSVKIIVDFRRG